LGGLLQAQPPRAGFPGARPAPNRPRSRAHCGCGIWVMAKTPAFAKAFAGRWRIAEMDVWDNDYLDLVEPAYIAFEGIATYSFV
ncbi:MAG: hypothetical protein K0R61_5514, partial [Microvirga sp.]|nr:hypothetical protein [Microvirga sp.]